MPVWQCNIALLLVTAIYTVGRAILDLHGVTPSQGVDLAWSFVFRMILVGWVYFDRRANGFVAPFEFDAFLFFAWIFVLPYYLLRTRGRRGLVLLVGFYGLAVLPCLAASIAGAVLR